MRYENWDVLLFPEGSKVPIQEFKTQCFVTKDTESPYLQNPSIVNPSIYYPVQGNFGQMPVLTSFIPTQPKDSPFRVSIHSWEKPRPSRLIEGLMQPDDMLLYEARVFIDGDCVAGGIFGQRTPWPYIIELSSNIDRDGNQDSLRFPPFHREILEQSHWDAGDTLGRIRVIIAEGFARPHRSPPFERVKDVVVLSFQHAPLNILEYSNIAWPNPSMWSHPSRADLKYNSTSSFADTKVSGDAHGHSPSKAAPTNIQSSSAVYNAWATGRAFPVPMSQQAWQQGYPDRWGGPPRYLGQEPCIEPGFVNEAAWRHRGARSSREDIPMPDYSSSSASSRAISGTSGNSGISYEAAVNMENEQYNILVQALTPTKPTGVRAPSNTPLAKGPGSKVGASPSGNVKGKKEKEKEEGKEKENDETPKKVTKEAPVADAEKDKEDDATSSVS